MHVLTLLSAGQVCWPIVAFLLAYLFGDLRGDTSFWCDKVCVNQEDTVMKVQTLQAIPAFIAKTSQLLLLWDDSLFERLWCNYELAVHAKTSSAPGAFKIVPMWQPIWTLTWLGSWVAISYSTCTSFSLMTHSCLNLMRAHSFHSSCRFGICASYLPLYSWCHRFLFHGFAFRSCSNTSPCWIKCQNLTSEMQSALWRATAG